MVYTFSVLDDFAWSSIEIIFSSLEKVFLGEGKLVLMVFLLVEMVFSSLEMGFVGEVNFLLAYVPLFTLSTPSVCVYVHLKARTLFVFFKNAFIPSDVFYISWKGWK